MSGHIVQFYEKKSFLSGVVADFIGEGLAAGQPAVVIATPSHRHAFAEELAARGLDGPLMLLDGEETLALFMTDGLPDEHRFKAAVAGLLTSHMRTYGALWSRARVSPGLEIMIKVPIARHKRGNSCFASKI